MMDPVTALGLAGNIVQFLDFATKLVGKAHGIYKSPDGSLAENLDVERVGQTMRILHSKLQTESNPSYDSEMEGLLDGICASCDATAKELLEILDTLKMQGKKTAWRSMRHAIKCIKGKAAVLEIHGRLTHLRDQLETTILVELRNANNVQFVANSERFNRLDRSAQEIVLAVLENRSILTTVVEAEARELKTIYDREASLSAFRHGDLKIATIEISKQQIQEHQTTREEVAQRATNEAVKLRAHIDKSTDEIKDLIKATQKAKGSRERNHLKERTNATAASLVAMDLIYGKLMGILAENRPNHGRQSWKVEPYSAAMQPVGNQTQPSRSINDTPSNSVPAKSVSSTNGSASNLSVRTSADSWDATSVTTPPSPKYQASQYPRADYNPFQYRNEPVEQQWPHSTYPPAPWNGQMQGPQPRWEPSRMPDMFPPMGYYPPQQHWPPSEPPARADPETEEKLLAIEELMENQKIDLEKARKELADRDAIEAADRAAAAAARKQAEEVAAWEKKMREKQDTLEKQIADEKAAWEKKVEEETKAALTKGKENAKKQMEADKKAEEDRQDALARGKAMAEAELRAKHFVLPWPSLWRGRKQPPIPSAEPGPSGDD